MGHYFSLSHTVVVVERAPPGRPLRRSRTRVASLNGGLRTSGYNAGGQCSASCEVCLPGSIETSSTGRSGSIFSSRALSGCPEPPRIVCYPRASVQLFQTTGMPSFEPRVVPSTSARHSIHQADIHQEPRFATNTPERMGYVRGNVRFIETRPERQRLGGVLRSALTLVCQWTLLNHLGKRRGG